MSVKMLILKNIFSNENTVFLSFLKRERERTVNVP
jgi:hypothetical protein